jgi:hypothetical protein
MTNTRLDRSTKSLISLGLVFLVALTTIRATVTPISSKIPPYTFAGTGNSYQINLDRYFDFTKVKYPVTITAEGLGTKPGYSFTDSFYSVELDKSKTYTNLKTMIMLDHNNFLVYGDISAEGNPSFDVVRCGTPKGLSLECVAKKTVPEKDKIILDKGFKLEDARYDPRSGVFITVWRDPVANKLALYSSDTVQDPSQEVINFVFLEMNIAKKDQPAKYAITNRARIELQTKIDGDKKEYTQIFVFDQKTNLSSDVEFTTTILTAKLSGSLFSQESITMTPDFNYNVDPENFKD